MKRQEVTVTPTRKAGDRTSVVFEFWTLSNRREKNGVKRNRTSKELENRNRT